MNRFRGRAGPNGVLDSVGREVALQTVHLDPERLMSDQASSFRPSRFTFAPLARPLAEARFQAAIVRALIDELDHGGANASMEAQLVEELELLSRRILQVADTMRENEIDAHHAALDTRAPSILPPPDSGRHMRASWPAWLDEAPEEELRVG